MEQRKESTSPCATTPEEGCTDRTGAGRTGVNRVGSGENEGKKGFSFMSLRLQQRLSVKLGVKTTAMQC